MPPEPAFRNDSYVTYVRKCLVFPSDGLEPRFVDMTIRTATLDDITNAQMWSRTVDLVATYGSEYRKLRVWHLSPSQGVAAHHLVYFNMSPKLPLNRCIARMVGVNTDELKSSLFWRGDVVVMGYEPDGGNPDTPHIHCQDVDTSGMGVLEGMLTDAHLGGRLERELADDEQLAIYSSTYSHWSTALFATIPWWGKWNWNRQEADFLNDINELKEYSRYRRPIFADSNIDTTTYFGFPTTWSTTIRKSLWSFFSSDRYITGPPKLPPELERQIFTECARNNRRACLELILVARRVRQWIEPILYETVILDKFTSASNPKINLFVASIDCKPPEFYSKHVKNLWISAADDPHTYERIFSVCSGVENLVFFPTRRTIIPPLLEYLDADSHLRRLTCHLQDFFTPESAMNIFQHACFANLTHLHMYDDNEDWPDYVGFENLRSLTHLALACCGPEEVAVVMPKLPALEYVALCYYDSRESPEYYVPRVSRRIPVEVYGTRVVQIEGLIIDDWERGATGRTDFWDLVEREVARRLEAGMTS